MSDDDTTINVDNLEKLIKALKAKPPLARVGILGGKALRNEARGKEPTNAEIGAAHEFGTSRLPQRSFLRVPISEHLKERLENAGAFNEAVLRAVVAGGSVLPWLKKIAVMAEGIVAEAFDTGGFGKWIPSDFRRKKNHQTLVETQQLRNSITSEVKET